MITYELIKAGNTAALDAARQLFIEYQTYLDENLCFQSFDEELKNIAGMYTAPTGALILAMDGDNYIGCVGVKYKSEGTCEMKRLYVKDAYKGKGIGRELVDRITAAAKALGYTKMLLDTLEKLQPALHLYRSVGFAETGAYYANPLANVVYMEKALH